MLRTFPWIQNELGLTLVMARDINFAGPYQGIESLIAQNELHVVTTTQKFPIGSMIYDVDSDSVYRYVEFGGTTKAGDIVQSELVDTNHDDLDPSGSAVGAQVAKGGVLISFADTLTLVVNEYAGGVMLVKENTGVGYRYPIESNIVAAGVANATVKLRAPGLALAIDSTTNVTLVKSRYKEVIIMPATITGMLVGASLGVGVNGSFGWVQTRGPASVLTDGVAVIGQHVRASDGTAGAVEPLDRDGTAEDEPEMGYVVWVGATGLQSLIFLTLE